MSFLKGLNVDSIKESIAVGVKAAQEGIANIDVGELVKSASDAAASGAKAVGDGAANFDLGELAQGAMDAAAGGIDAVGKAVEGFTQGAGEEETAEPSPQKFIELLWCLAYADEVITDAERETLDELSASIDVNYESYRDDLEAEFAQRLAASSKEYGHAAAVKVEAKGIIEALDLGLVEAKLLCWNLLALSSADENDESELDLIRFIGEQLGLEASIVEELRNYSAAITETAAARDQLKQSARSYSEIEPLVVELEKREQTLIEAAQSLISDK